MKLCNIDETMYMYGWNLLLLVTCVGYAIFVLCMDETCYYLYICVFDFLWKWMGIRRNRINAYLVSLPSEADGKEPAGFAVC